MALTPPTGSNPWLVSSTISTQGSSYNITLATAGQLLDRDIEVSVKASLTQRTPTFSSTALSINSLTPSFSTNMTTAATGTYYIEPSAFAQTNSPKVSYTNSAGYIAAHTNSAAVTLASVSSTATAAKVYIPTASPSFKGGALTLTNSSNVITVAGMTTTTTQTNYYIDAAASGTMNRAAVQYSGAVSGYLSKANNAAAYAAGTSDFSDVSADRVYIPAAAGTVAITGGTVKMSTPTTAHVSFSTAAPAYSGIYIKAIASQSAKISAKVSITASGYTPVNSAFASSSKAISAVSATYYITGVTLENNSTFDITIPNGAESTITLHFAVDASGNTTIS